MYHKIDADEMQARGDDAAKKALQAMFKDTPDVLAKNEQRQKEAEERAARGDNGGSGAGGSGGRGGGDGDGVTPATRLWHAKHASFRGTLVHDFWTTHPNHANADC
jgi:hypothetical protein